MASRIFAGVLVVTALAAPIAGRAQSASQPPGEGPTFQPFKTVCDRPPARRRVTISTEVSAGDVAVSVRDTGSGLPDEIRRTLFTPFVTTKAHGLGVELAIARTIVDVHGGTIDAHDNSEGGSTFIVTLRCKTPKSLSGPPGSA